MPNELVGFSNENYRYVDRNAEVRGISFSRAVNDMVEDYRIRKHLERVKLHREIESGMQLQLQ